MSGIQLVDPASVQEKPKAGQGHLHYRVDDGPVIATTAPKLSFHELSPGEHRFELTLAGNDHQPLMPSKTLRVTVPEGHAQHSSRTNCHVTGEIMSKIEKSIDVNVPVRTAYDQWTQFEEFPNFMEGVESVQQLDDRRLHWRAEIGGKMVEWDAEIAEQIPDTRIAWRSTSGAPECRRRVVLSPLRRRCRVTLQIDYEPEGVRRDGGRLARRDEPARRGRPRAVQEVHRGARRRDGRVARDDSVARQSLAA